MVVFVLGVDDDEDGGGGGGGGRGEVEDGAEGCAGLGGWWHFFCGNGNGRGWVR